MRRLLNLMPLALAVLLAAGPALAQNAPGGSSPALERLRAAPAAQAAPAAPGGQAAPTARQEVLEKIERLKREIALLDRLRRSQESLVKWNAGRATAGLSPAALPRSLCAHPEIAVWCRRLPFTFTAGDEER